jgi:hypothetical protein
MEARFEGTLEYDPNSKCLFFRHDNGSRSAPLWPKGTKPVIHDDKRGVEVRGNGRILEGDRVDASGGGTDRAAVADLNIPESCIPEGREGSTLPRIRCARVEFGSSGLIVISRLD